MWWSPTEQRSSCVSSQEWAASNLRRSHLSRATVCSVPTCRWAMLSVTALSRQTATDALAFVPRRARGSGAMRVPETKYARSGELAIATRCTAADRTICCSVGRRRQTSRPVAAASIGGGPWHLYRLCAAILEGTGRLSGPLAVRIARLATARRRAGRRWRLCWPIPVPSPRMRPESRRPPHIRAEAAGGLPEP